MIWFLVDSSSLGGIERHIETLAVALKRRGIPVEVVLYADHGANPWCRQLEAAGLKHRALAGSPPALLSEMRRSAPALVHTHGYKANIFGRFAARILGTPVVSTFHAGERGAFPVNLYQALDEYSSFLGARLCVSAAIQQTLPYGARLTENFIAMAPPPVSTALARHVGFVGRLSNEKGPDFFCELAERCADIAEFHVWGDGPMRASLEARYGRHVLFHGLTTDISQAWRKIGLLAMPSRAEGMPMAALEALSQGIPLLASNVGGLPRLIPHAAQTGWLFEVGDLSAAEAALREWAALDSKAQASLRASCVAHIRAHFSEEAHLPTILEAYRDAGFKLKRGLARAA
ncbi:MAG: hypothetical protein RL291_634 [Pseudomonadota bacterium]|jgi:glycosyltransferase involved in cell wall biosynthesis